MARLSNTPTEKKIVVKSRPLFLAGGMAVFLLLSFFYFFKYTDMFSIARIGSRVAVADVVVAPIVPTVVPTITPPLPTLDTVAYDKKMLALANLSTPISVPVVPVTPKKSTAGKLKSTQIEMKTIVDPKSLLWPVKTVYPNAGAILPFSRIVAYYGNFYSKMMGVLGQYPEDVVLQKLDAEVKKWSDADPSTPVIPAIDYIAVTAQGSPSQGGKYRLRMPASEIQKAIDMANKIHGLVFLEIQAGQSNFQTEVPLLEEYLKMPNVELSLDPEFFMKTGAKPGTVIGTVDATDVNYAINYLSDLVKADNLSPKIVVVHRFTGAMVTNYKQIAPTPEVEVVMDMDGWGPPSMKLTTYNTFISPQPVQFAGFKLFYKNDLLPPSTHMLAPAEILKLEPQPIFIQYQ